MFKKTGKTTTIGVIKDIKDKPTAPNPPNPQNLDLKKQNEKEKK